MAVSPGEMPWNDEEKERMKRLNDTDDMVDSSCPCFGHMGIELKF